MKVESITLPDFSRNSVTIHKLVPKENNKRVKKVAATAYLNAFSQKNKGLDLYF